jgi:hypothetical protein
MDCFFAQKLPAFPASSLREGLALAGRGEFAMERMTEIKKLTIKGWEDGLVGEIAKEGKEITWSNGTSWKRP